MVHHIFYARLIHTKNIDVSDSHSSITSIFFHSRQTPFTYRIFFLFLKSHPFSVCLALHSSREKQISIKLTAISLYIEWRRFFNKTYIYTTIPPWFTSRLFCFQQSIQYIVSCTATKRSKSKSECTTTRAIRFPWDFIFFSAYTNNGLRFTVCVFHFPSKRVCAVRVGMMSFVGSVLPLKLEYRFAYEKVTFFPIDDVNWRVITHSNAHGKCASTTSFLYTIHTFGATPDFWHWHTAYTVQQASFSHLLTP